MSKWVNHIHILYVRLCPVQICSRKRDAASYACLSSMALTNFVPQVIQRIPICPPEIFFGAYCVVDAQHGPVKLYLETLARLHHRR